MSEQVLLRFLSNGLIDVGGDDTKLEKLKTTSGDLATSLRENPGKAASFALIAFDPDAPVNDPVIQEATQALQKRWPTYVNTFSGTPIAVVRAMLLDALVQTSVEDHNIAVAFAACARNVLPFMEVGGEQAIWSDVTKRIEEQVDERAEREWATPSQINVEPLTFKSPASLPINVSSGKLDKVDLQTKVSAASGPTGVPNANPHWPNNPPQWAQQFAPKLADAIAEAIEASKTKVAPVDFSAPLEQLTNAVAKYVTGGMTAFAAATTGLQRRTNLIWWREALFSPTSRGSYRSLPPSVAAGMMAFDLYSQVPAFSPASVAAFLSETVMSLPGLVGDQTYSIGSLADELRTDERLLALREAAKGLVSASGRRGFLLALAANFDPTVKIDDQTFKNLVGVAQATKITLSQWSGWIFREFQAARATKARSGSKPQVRKAEEK